MYLLVVLLWVSAALAADTAASTDGIRNLVKRRIPDHVDDFEFRLTGDQAEFPLTGQPAIDEYSVSSTVDGKILVEGSSPIALASGYVSIKCPHWQFFNGNHSLHRYLTDTIHVDIWWYIGSRLHLAPSSLPPLDVPMNGTSVVPWRYFFNTGTVNFCSIILLH
jgi:alpha-N-acetylglucosaminidase